MEYSVALNRRFHMLSQGGAFGGKETKATVIALPAIVAAHK